VIRRAALAFVLSMMLLIAVAEIQRLDAQIEEGEFHHVTTIQHGGAR
jgi:hypothetical protein